MPMTGVTIPADDADKILHISLPIGNDVLMGSDALESLGQHVVKGNNSYITVYPDSKEEADRIFRLLSAGGEVEMPMGEMPWGDYYGTFADQYGIQWMISYAKTCQKRDGVQPHLRRAARNCSGVPGPIRK